jgi:copper(I)-binding protein
MKNLYTFLIIGILAMTNANAFMTGVKPEKDGGVALEMISGVIHTAPPGSNVNAGYGILKNNTDKDIVLKSFRSPVFDNTEVHNMEYSDSGIAKMRHLEELRIPANGELSLENGGLHLMFIGMRRDILVDEKIMIISRDAHEVRYMLIMKVIDPRSNNDDSHHMH